MYRYLIFSGFGDGFEHDQLTNLIILFRRGRPQVTHGPFEKTAGTHLTSL